MKRETEEKEKEEESSGDEIKFKNSKKASLKELGFDVSSPFEELLNEVLDDL